MSNLPNFNKLRCSYIAIKYFQIQNFNFEDENKVALAQY